MEPLWVDYHCHLDLYQDYQAQYINCTEQRVATLAVTTTPRAWKRNKELASASEMVRVGLGLHPQLLGRNYRQELAMFEDYVGETSYIGEVGLDAGQSHYNTYQDQKIAFEEVLKLCAQSTGKILSVHAVRSYNDLTYLIEKYLAGTDSQVVMHWFSGNASDLRRCVELGCYFSVNQAMLASKNGKARIANIPRERLLTETDGPFIKTGSHPTVPMDAARTIESLATLLDIPAGAVQRQVLENLKRIETPITKTVK